MATKKKKKAVGAHKKKRRVGAVSPIETMVLQAVGAVVGGLGTSFVASMADTALGANINPVITRAGLALTGIGVSYAGRKIPLVQGIGLGITTVGGVMAANEAGLNVPGIAGIPAVGAMRRRPVGSAPLRAVGQPNNMPSVSGRRLKAVGALYSN